MSTSGAAPAGGPPSGAAGGDLGGVYPAPGVVGLQGRGISATAPTDTQGLIWNNGLGLWVPTSIAQPSPSNLVTGPDAFGAVPVVGTAATFSRGDHNHGLPANPTPAFAAPTIALGTAAAAGVAGTIIRSDATLAAFDATAPTTSAVGDAAGVGVAAVTARRDHRHGREAFAVPAIVLGTAAAAGAAATPIRSDSTIVAFDVTAPVVQSFGDAAGAGAAAVAARRDHRHGMPAQPHQSIWGFSERNLVSSVANQILWRVLGGTGNTFSAVTDPIVFPRAGSATGLMASFNPAVSAGSFTLTLFINGVASALTLVVTGGAVGSSTGAVAFAANDLLTLRVTTTAAFAPSGTSVECGLEVAA